MEYASSVETKLLINARLFGVWTRRERSRVLGAKLAFPICGT